MVTRCEIVTVTGFPVGWDPRGEGAQFLLAFWGDLENTAGKHRMQSLVTHLVS